MGLLATGTSCFALVWVIGRSRVPAPPERIRPFMRRASYPVVCRTTRSDRATCPPTTRASCREWCPAEAGLHCRAYYLGREHDAETGIGARVGWCDPRGRHHRG